MSVGEWGGGARIRVGTYTERQFTVYLLLLPATFYKYYNLHVVLKGNE